MTEGGVLLCIDVGLTESLRFHPEGGSGRLLEDCLFRVEEVRWHRREKEGATLDWVDGHGGVSGERSALSFAWMRAVFSWWVRRLIARSRFMAAARVVNHSR